MGRGLLQPGDEVGQILRGHTLFEPFRHEGKLGGPDFPNVRAQNLFCQPAPLHEGKTGGSFALDDPGKRAAIFGFDVVSEEIGVDGSVGIEDGEHKIGDAFAGELGQIRSDRLAMTAVGVARGTILLKEGSAVFGHAGQGSYHLVFGKDLGAV